MKRIYHLSTCDTCRKILSQVDTDDVELVNLKTQNVTAEDLEIMKKATKSYKALFNMRAQKLKELPESKKPNKEADYKKLILSEYTFLKRPAAIIENNIIIGNNKEAVDSLIQILPKVNKPLDTK